MGGGFRSIWLSVSGPNGDFSVLVLARLKRTRLLPLCSVSNGPYKFDKYNTYVFRVHREVLLDAKNSFLLAMVPVYHQYYG